MRALLVACLYIGAAATAEAGANCAHSQSWQCKPAPAPTIGSGIPAALGCGVLLAASLFARRRKSIPDYAATSASFSRR